jgi:hypothetical protein
MAGRNRRGGARVWRFQGSFAQIDGVSLQLKPPVNTIPCPLNPEPHIAFSSTRHLILALPPQ